MLIWEKRLFQNHTEDSEPVPAPVVKGLSADPKQHLVLGSTGCPYGELQRAAATQFTHHPSLQHGNLPKQQSVVKKYWQGTNKERKCPQTISVEAVVEQINNFSKLDYGGVHDKARNGGAHRL